MIRVKTRGNFNNTERFFKKASGINIRRILEKYGQAGVDALASFTPVETGKTAAAWSYEITRTSSGYSVVWKNSNVNDGVNIALILQYGHGTRNGGYVEGIDYINPALQPIFEEMSNEIWKEVASK